MTGNDGVIFQELQQELQDEINSYLANQISIWDLYSWLAAHVQAVADVSDPRLSDLEGQVFSLIAEWLNGYRAEANVRNELDNLVAESHTPVGIREIEPPS